MSTVITIICNTICFIAVWIALFLILVAVRDRYKNAPKEPDTKLLKTYAKTLDKMIEYEAFYQVNIMLSNNNSLSVKSDIDNDALVECANETSKKVITNMSPSMREYLSDAYGADWIIRYISVRGQRLVLQYSESELNQFEKL